jgi:protoporphyrinogen oxidase
MSRAPIVVIGAGVAGLAAASQLARHGIAQRVVEAGPRVAGMADSQVDEHGFTCDIGAHFITNRLAAACGISGRCQTVRHYGETFHLQDGGEYRFPFGVLRSGRFVSSAVRQQLADRLFGHGLPANAAERFAHEFGPAVAEAVAIPIVEAWSGLPATQLSPAVADKIPKGVLRTLWLKAAQRLTKRAVAMGYCRDRPESSAVFHVHPRRGVAELCQALAARLPAPVETECPAERIYVEGGRVVGVRLAGRDADASAVLSTLPVSRLHHLIVGSDAAAAFAGFRYRALVLVNLKLHGHGLLPDTLVWTPRGFPFFRLSEAPRAIPWLAPEGKTVVLCELGAQVGDPVWTMSDDEVVRRCCEALRTFIPDVEGRLIGFDVMRQPLGYPIFALDYEDRRQRLQRQGTGIEGLFSIGRNGEFDHLLMEDIYWRTIRLVERLVATQDDAAVPTARGVRAAEPVANVDLERRAAFVSIPG